MEEIFLTSRSFSHFYHILSNFVCERAIKSISCESSAETNRNFPDLIDKKSIIPAVSKFLSFLEGDRRLVFDSYEISVLNFISNQIHSQSLATAIRSLMPLQQKVDNAMNVIAPYVESHNNANDFLFIADGKTFRCHMVLAALLSKKVSSFLTADSNCRQLELQNPSWIPSSNFIAALESVVSLLDGQPLRICKENSAAVAEISSQIENSEISQAISEYLNRIESTLTKNESILKAPLNISDASQNSEHLSKVAGSLHEIGSLSSLMNFSVAEVSQVLKQQSLRVQSEKQLCNSLVLYAHARGQMAATVLSFLRFKFLGSESIESIIGKFRSFPKSVLKAISERLICDVYRTQTQRTRFTMLKNSNLDRKVSEFQNALASKIATLEKLRKENAYLKSQMKACKISCVLGGRSSQSYLKFEDESTKERLVKVTEPCPRSICLPEGIIYIDSKAFSKSKVVSIRLPHSVTEIGDEAFYECRNLCSVRFFNSVSSIGSWAFCNCESLTNAFIIPQNVKEIQSGTFGDCKSLTSIILSKNIQSIDSYAFENCKSLTTFSIPEPITVIKDSTFYGCSSLKAVDLNPNIVAISRSAFENCESLSGEFQIPPKVTSIDIRTFCGCYSLNSVAFPKALTPIESHSGQCYQYDESVNPYDCRIFTYSGCQPPPSLNYRLSVASSAFERCSKSLQEKVSQMFLIYERFSNQSVVIGISGEMSGNIEIPEGVVKIGPGAFATTGITSIKLPKSVETIGDCAFAGCKALRSISFHENLRSIGKNCFEDCGKISGDFILPPKMKDIQSSVFYGCCSINSILLHEGIQSIGSNAFCFCESISTIFIPPKVKEIKEGTFCGCFSMRSIQLPDGIEKIGANAFQYCSSLTYFIIPPKVREISEGTFSDCKSLKSIDVHDGIEAIGKSAFCMCVALSGKFVIPPKVKKIEDSTFAGCRQLKSIEIHEGVESIQMSAFKSDPKGGSAGNIPAQIKTPGRFRKFLREMFG